MIGKLSKFLAEMSSIDIVNIWENFKFVVKGINNILKVVIKSKIVQNCNFQNLVLNCLQRLPNGTHKSVLIIFKKQVAMI